ncbi:MAG: protein kinase [Clostridiales bacterium]|nr:protein kinase [Clostridiales bacterium]
MESRLIGKVVSRRFRIEEIIGSGGMAIVYRAYDLRSKRTVAFKVLREEYEKDEEFLARFNREADALKKLNHPNIVNLIDSGSVGDMHYIALEFVDGKTLKDLIREKGKLTEQEAVHYALQILAALGHAHSRRIIHRDVKSQNIMVTRNGQMKVADFGIAGIADTQTLSGNGVVIGSVHYFSPEQAKGMRATEASDLYSVGIILYEMLTGHVPFDGETSVSVAMMHLMKEAEPVETQADVSDAIAGIVRKALRKQPGERYQSADAMIRDLRRGLRHPDGRFLQQEEEHTKRIQQIRRGEGKGWFPYLVAILTIVLVTGTIFGGYQLYRMLFVFARVPDLAGLDQNNAGRMAENAGFLPEWIYEYNESVPAGDVVGQSPEPGTTTARGSSLMIRLSRGSGRAAVPRVIGMTQAEAEALLIEKGFRIGNPKEMISELMKGLVVAQEPEAGTQAFMGDEVVLVLSVGRVVVPKLVQLREEEAVEKLEQVGLSLGGIQEENVRSAAQDGVVQNQSLPQFLEVQPGEVISLTVGRYAYFDKTAKLELSVDIPEKDSRVRITLVEESMEYDMFAMTYEEPGPVQISATLRSETSGPKKWRLYINGNLKEEREITIL